MDALFNAVYYTVELRLDYNIYKISGRILVSMKFPTETYVSFANFSIKKNRNLYNNFLYCMAKTCLE